MKGNQTVIDNFLLFKFHQYWENAYWRKYTMNENISVYLNFLFPIKQKKFLNELNSLVANSSCYLLVIKINELVRVYSLWGLRSFQLLSFF